jgi:hypothetical protein
MRSRTFVLLQREFVSTACDINYGLQIPPPHA